MKRKAVFLDRDGVVNACPGEAYYVRTWSEFKFVPGAPEALAALAKAGYLLVVVSNQSGIARGRVRQADLDDITRRMRAALESLGAPLADVLYCPHDDKDACECRKPKPGLFREALARHGIDAAASWNVGDAERDIEAGLAAGVRGIWVLSGKTGAEDAARAAARPAAVKKDLREAAEWILNPSK